MYSMLILTVNGIVGATLHTPFAVTARAAYGYYGSKFPIISRMIIACTPTHLTPEAPYDSELMK